MRPGRPNTGSGKGNPGVFPVQFEVMGFRDRFHSTFGTKTDVMSMLLPVDLTGEMWKLAID